MKEFVIGCMIMVAAYSMAKCPNMIVLYKVTWVDHRSFSPYEREAYGLKYETNPQIDFKKRTEMKKYISEIRKKYETEKRKLEVDSVDRYMYALKWVDRSEISSIKGQK